MTAPFDLDPRLAADTAWVADLPLSALRLMNDARYPWLILVPRRPALVEIIDLDAPARTQLMEEVAAVATALKRQTGCDKLNVGALGNIVAQLHIHVIARRAGDAAWPGPVWGAGTAVAYEPRARAALIGEVAALL